MASQRTPHRVPHEERWGRHARARKRTNVPRWSMGQWTSRMLSIMNRRVSTPSGRWPGSRKPVLIRQGAGGGSVPSRGPKVARPPREWVGGCL